MFANVGFSNESEAARSRSHHRRGALAKAPLVALRPFPVLCVQRSKATIRGQVARPNLKSQGCFCWACGSSVISNGIGCADLATARAALQQALKILRGHSNYALACAVHIGNAEESDGKNHRTSVPIGSCHASRVVRSGHGHW